MRVRYQTSFDKSFDKLSKPEQHKTLDAVQSLIAFFDTKEKPSKGMGLKKLRGNIWEVRATQKIRILFQIEQDILTFILTGNHNDIRRFISQH